MYRLSCPGCQQPPKMKRTLSICPQDQAKRISSDYHFQTSVFRVTHLSHLERKVPLHEFREKSRPEQFLLIIQFSSVAQLCLTLCNPMDSYMPGLPVHQQLPEFAQIHVHQVDDAIQPSHPLSSPSPPTFNISQHQGLFQGVNSYHKVAKVLELQLQHQFFQ